jgi:hypothetical protein
MSPENLELVLTIVSGVCWMFVYIDGIQLGFKDKSYAIPFYALALNLAWELIHAIRGLAAGPDVQTFFNCIWFLFDVGILWTYLKFGIKYFPPNIPQRWFGVWTLLGLVAAFLVEFAFIREFDPFIGGAYAAFLQNLLMSVLFITMLVRRGSREGQSFVIAVNKWIGTLAPTILFGVIGSGAFRNPSFLILVLGLLCSVFDLVYIYLLSRARHFEVKAV